MKLYSANDYQLISKYCLSLEKEIQSIINFIDTFNPNYILLNRVSDSEQQSYYYTDDQLRYLDIINDTSIPSYINLSKMRPHQIVENHYGKELSIKRDGTILANETLPQGYALRHEGYNENQIAQYTIISLASSGTYFIVSNIEYAPSQSATEQIVNITWQQQENATDLYGLSYMFSIILEDERCYWHGEGTTYRNLVSLDNNQWTSPLILPNFISSGNDITLKIGSEIGSYWTNSKLLWHEIYRFENNYVEDVIDDGTAEVTVARVGENPQSRYNITTNMVRWPDTYINLL